MPTKQGDVGLLHDPVAQHLLQSKGPAHLAYNWHDGTPRVLPIGFHPRMTRIFIHPDWVGIIDFETRLPSAVEREIERG